MLGQIEHVHHVCPFIRHESPSIEGSNVTVPRDFSDKIAALDPILKKFDEELANEKAKLGEAPMTRSARPSSSPASTGSPKPSRLSASRCWH